MTSSFAAVGYGREPQSAPYTEKDWTDPHGEGLTPYAKSKTLAEKAAWEFIGREGWRLELSVVNPVAVFGPVLGADYATSIMLVQRMMDGALPGCPRLCFGVVDVRDVAQGHLLAWERGRSGERQHTEPKCKFHTFLSFERRGTWRAPAQKILSLLTALQ